MTQAKRLRIAILDDYERAIGGHDAIAALADRVEISAFDRPMDNPLAYLKDFDGICLIRERMAFPASLIAALPKLQFLAFTGARNPSLDQAAAAKAAITVSNTPGGPAKASTAELTWALILAASKQLLSADAGMRAGNWRADASGRRWPVPSLLSGKRLGLVGCGQIGQRVAAVAQAFGMEVLAWSPNLTEARARDANVTRVDKAELFSQCDVLSIHLVMAESTRAIVGVDDIARMPNHAILVNTSRAGLIDMPALLDALGEGRIGHAGLDVYPAEPMTAEHPLGRLLSLPNVTLSPHLGYVVEPVLDAFASGLADVIASWHDGKPVNVVSAG